MSYDICFRQDVCGSCGQKIPNAREFFYWNYTSNMAPAWRAAGVDLNDFDGRKAKDCIAPLKAAIEEMRRNWSRYEAMEPKNGWGKMVTLVPELERLLKAFEDSPELLVEVTR